jgi:MFS family permease
MRPRGSGSAAGWLSGPLRALLALEFVSSAGTAMTVLAVTFYTYSTTGSLFQSVLTTVAFVLPAVALGFTAGRIADERDPARTWILADVGKALLYVVLGLIAAADALTVPILILCQLGLGSFSALAYPAMQGYLRGLVSGETLDELQAAWSGAGSLGTVVGAALSGFVFDRFGPAPVFLFNALTYLPLFLILARTPSRRPAPSAAAHPPAQEVLRHIRAVPRLRGALLTAAVLSLLLVPVNQVLPALAGAVRPGPHMLGFLSALIAAGSATAFLRLRRLKAGHDARQIQHRVLRLGSLILLIVGSLRLREGTILAPGSAWLFVAIGAAMFFTGLMIGLGKSVLSAELQRESHPAMIGSTVALLGATFAVCSSLGGLLLAAGSESLDVFTVLGLAGLLLAAYALALWWAELRRPTPIGEPAPEPVGTELDRT